MIKSDFRELMPERPGRVHFVGIGGAGMSGIARLMHASGLEVTGSDARDSATVAGLREAGIPVVIGHEGTGAAEADTVVVTGALGEDNPEYLLAKARGVPVVHRARALAWLTGRRRVVAVAGAHGKTTSTSMVVTALQSLGADPGFVNGGVISQLGTSAAPGSDGLFVIEADESDGSFLLYDTDIALVTNVDPDHLDHFGSEEAFYDAFVAFAAGASEAVVIGADDPGARLIAPRLERSRVTTFGLADDADVRIHSLELSQAVSFRIRYEGRDHAVRLRVAGTHNAVNAAGAFAVMVRLGHAPTRAAEALADFEGTERRFELRGEVGGVRVYDDFAHHPTELEAALTGARPVVGTGRIIPVFQPHLFSRTRMRAADFAGALESLADHTVLVPIYPARELPEPGVTSALIRDRFTDPSRAEYWEGWADAARAAARAAEPGDAIVTMGGGDVFRIVPLVLDALRERFGS